VSSTPDWIERLLAADPGDAGCDEVMAVMDVYVDLRAAGLDPEARHPGVAAHLPACDTCTDHVRGLLAAVSDAHLVTAGSGLPTPTRGRCRGR